MYFQGVGTAKFHQHSLEYVIKKKQ